MPIKKCFQQTFEQEVNLFTAKYCFEKDKKERSWVFASRKSKPACMTLENEPDCVCVFPIIQTTQGRRIVVISQFRPALGRAEIDFPAGKIDPGETPLQAAKRELKEETGLGLKNVLFKTPPLFPSAGLTDESCIIFFVEASGIPSTSWQEEDENIDIMELSLTEATELMNDETKHFSMKCWLILAAFGQDLQELK